MKTLHHQYSIAVFQIMTAFIKNMFTVGWDSQHGGLFYFLDVDGFPPQQLEWDMKLWWPLCETMVAMLTCHK